MDDTDWITKFWATRSTATIFWRIRLRTSERWLPVEERTVRADLQIDILVEGEQLTILPEDANAAAVQVARRWALALRNGLSCLLLQVAATWFSGLGRQHQVANVGGVLNHSNLHILGDRQVIFRHDSYRVGQKPLA